MVEGLTEKGQKLKMRITVVDVSKVLASVSKICECGNRVIFDEAGSYIEDKHTGERTPLHKRNGVYVMNMKIRKGKEGQREPLMKKAKEFSAGWVQI